MKTVTKLDLANRVASRLALPASDALGTCEAVLDGLI
jgi:hypothetical protein